MTDKIWINYRSWEQKYHTEKCRAVKQSSHMKPITDEDAISQEMDRRERCKFCSGDWTPNDTNRTEHYHALQNTDASDL